MRRTVLTFLVAAAGVLGLTGLALAQHNEPSQAKKFQTTFVTPYNACTAPNTTTKTLPLPACTAVRSDPTCGFDTTAKGKASVKTGISGSGASQVIKISGKVSGLDAGCEGKTLAFVSTVRATTDDCVSPPCTILEAVTHDFPTGITCGPIASGACSFSGSVGPGTLAPGADTGLQLEGCALLNGSAHTIDCGILFP